MFKMYLVNKSIVVIFFNIFCVYGQLYRGDNRSLRNGTPGICRLLTDCQEAMDNLQKRIFPQHCGFEGPQVIVCCALVQTKPSPKPTTPSTERLPGVISAKKCLEYSKYVWVEELNPTLLITGKNIRRNECPFNRQELVVGGSPSERKEFPHMVQFGYDGRGQKQWTCGGSLISEQFVLTAAHCLSDRFLGDAKYARMGIVDLDDENHMQQFNIIQIVPHPKYEEPSHYHDIGLAKLHKKAELNSWVRPACLYTKNESPGSKVIASGWGKTDFAGPESTILLRVILELYNEASCIKTFRQQTGTSKLQEGIRDDIMICAGHSKELKDTCQGDSGGPLQIYRNGDKQTTCMYDVIGVTSFGKVCGIAVNTPAVYTRVSHYIPWIENIVWPV